MAIPYCRLFDSIFSNCSSGFLVARLDNQYDPLLATTGPVGCNGTWPAISQHILANSNASGLMGSISGNAYGNVFPVVSPVRHFLKASQQDILLGWNSIDHVRQFVERGAFVRPVTLAGPDDVFKGRGDGPLNLDGNGCVGVDKALDAQSEIVDIRFLCPARVQATVVGNLWRYSQSPPALQIAHG